MRKFLLTLTTGFIAAGAFSGTSQAAWVWRRPVITVAAPVVIVPPVVTPVVYPPPLDAPLYPRVVVYRHWHDRWYEAGLHRAYW